MNYWKSTLIAKYYVNIPLALTCYINYPLSGSWCPLKSSVKHKLCSKMNSDFNKTNNLTAAPSRG